jgi:hypothetical protein
MKKLLIATLCLFSARQAAAECVAVTPANFSFGLNAVPSLKDVRITVTLDRTPLPHAQLRVYTETGSFLFAASADDQGVAELHNLKSGRYVIDSQANEAGARILLDVPANPQKGVSQFSLSMSNRYAVPPIGGFPIKAGEIPEDEHYREFTGVVRDESGASVPGAEIEVFPEATSDHARITHLTADDAGHFSAQLPNGLYRAVIHMEGLKPYAVAFRILREGDARTLSAVLRVQSC